MSDSFMLRQRQYVETLEGGSSINVWARLRGRRCLWAANFLEGPRSKDGKVKIRWAGYSKSSFQWVPSSDVHVPYEDLYIPHSVSKHRFKDDGTKEYLLRWGNESYTWETEENESVRESGILDVYEMQTAVKAPKAGAATVFAVLRHEFSPRTGLTEVDMKSIKFCAGLVQDSEGPPTKNHENDYGLIERDSKLSVWLPIAGEWLHCIVAECHDRGRDRVAKRRRNSATKSRFEAAPKQIAKVRKNPKKRSSGSISCGDGRRASRPNQFTKHDSCGDEKAADGFPKPKVQTTSKRGMRRGSGGKARPNSCVEEPDRGGSDGGEAPVHARKVSVGDEETAGGCAIPKGHEARDDADDDAEAPSVAELDELDLNEFYLGGAPHDALWGMANGLQILDGVVTGYAIAQEFGPATGREDDPSHGLSFAAAVSVDGADCNDADVGQTSLPDPETDDELVRRSLLPALGFATR